MQSWVFQLLIKVTESLLHYSHIPHQDKREKLYTNHTQEVNTTLYPLPIQQMGTLTGANIAKLVQSTPLSCLQWLSLAFLME